MQVHVIATGEHITFTSRGDSVAVRNDGLRRTQSLAIVDVEPGEAAVVLRKEYFLELKADAKEWQEYQEMAKLKEVGD
jgi:hypothetical protein